MANGVLVPQAIAALNIDSYNRSVIDSSGSPIDNGNVFKLGDKHTSGSLTEVWELEQASSGSPTDMWMAYSGDEIVLTASKYKGLDPDPRNFFNAAGDVFSAYKPQVGDIILVTADALDGTMGSNEYVVAVADSFKLTWNAQATDGLSYNLIDTKYISLATGGIDDQRVTAYQFECVSI